MEHRPDTVRAPDIAVVRRERFADHDLRRYLPFAPDLAVEVLSPGDTAPEARARAAMYYTPSESPRHSQISRERSPQAPAAAGGEEGEAAPAALRGPPRLCRGSGVRGSPRSAHAGEDLPPPPSRQRGRGPSRPWLRAVPALWLSHGARLVWMVDPVARRVTVHAPDAPPRELGETDTLDGGGLLPGFTLPVPGIFE